VVLQTLCVGVLAAAIVTLAGCGPSTDAPSPSARTVSGTGFGPVKFGMKVEDAEKALGVKLAKDTYAEDESCRYFTPVNALDGLSFMTSNGIVVRLDVHKGDIATDTGAKIGDSETSVLDLYKGHVRVEPHKYTGPEGHYLVVTGSDGKAQMVFETDGTKVTTYRAGREPEVQFVEGCA
jgi:hypothetical protein